MGYGEYPVSSGNELTKQIRRGDLSSGITYL
jgi:hypothetical protein